jgi:hypothetical protein
MRVMKLPLNFVGLVLIIDWTFCIVREMLNSFLSFNPYFIKKTSGNRSNNAFLFLLPYCIRLSEHSKNCNLAKGWDSQFECSLY